MKTMLLMFLAVAVVGAGCTSPPSQAVAPYSDAPINQTNRFDLTRAPVVSFGESIQADSARKQRLAESFIPSLNAEDQIIGFRVSDRCEPELSARFGLQTGDILLKINSIRITRSRRLEYLADEFMKNRANIFILDLNRDGTRLRQIYVFR
jgi:type II secretory pathway component PulC